VEIEQARAGIRRELESGEAACVAGNDGKARVCARRAAGIAIAYWLYHHPERIWGLDAMTRLNHVRADSTFPAEIREAATRLTTKITGRFSSAFSTNPLDDCRILADYFLGGR